MDFVDYIICKISDVNSESDGPSSNVNGIVYDDRTSGVLLPAMVWRRLMNGKRMRRIFAM